VPFGFRRKQQRKEEQPVASAPQPTLPPVAPASPASAAVATQPRPAAAVPPQTSRPIPQPIANGNGGNGIHKLPLKEQATGNDARAERMFRQVRADVDDLRKQLGQRRNVDHEFAELDIAAVANNPEAAALIPPEALVKALVEAHAANQRLEKKLGRARARTARGEARLRRFKEARAFEQGRLETLDRVIEALHGNLEDLRLARDSAGPLVGERPEPRVLRPGPEALPPAENG
jgi:hypothetical protein